MVTALLLHIFKLITSVEVFFFHKRGFVQMLQVERPCAKLDTKL